MRSLAAKSGVRNRSVSSCQDTVSVNDSRAGESLDIDCWPIVAVLHNHPKAKTSHFHGLNTKQLHGLKCSSNDENTPELTPGAMLYHAARFHFSADLTSPLPTRRNLRFVLSSAQAFDAGTSGGCLSTHCSGYHLVVAEAL